MASLINKWLFFPLLSLFLVSASPVPHPFHVSVVEINHNSQEKTLEISCKIFTDDFEKILAKNYAAKVDLINPPDKAAMDSLVKKYLMSHLSIASDGKPVRLNYLGFEHVKEAVFVYIEVENIPHVQKMAVSTNLMYDQFEDQVNIIHVIVNGNRKSTKLNFPETDAEIIFSQ